MFPSFAQVAMWEARQVFAFSCHGCGSFPLTADIRDGKGGGSFFLPKKVTWGSERSFLPSCAAPPRFACITAEEGSNDLSDLLFPHSAPAPS